MTYRSDKVFIGIEILILTSSITDDIVKLQLIAEEATNATEALHELESLCALVSDELDGETPLFVMHEEPISKSFLGLNFKDSTCFFVLEVLRVLLLCFVQVLDPGLFLSGDLEFEALHFDVLEKNHLLKSAHFVGFERVINTEDYVSSVLSNFVHELADDLLFLDKLDAGQAISSQGDGLGESIVLTV